MRQMTLVEKARDQYMMADKRMECIFEDALSEIERLTKEVKELKAKIKMLQ